jgi:hypothetical protein
MLKKLFKSKKAKVLGAMPLALSLAACGGGGGSISYSTSTTTGDTNDDGITEVAVLDHFSGTYRTHGPKVVNTVKSETDSLVTEHNRANETSNQTANLLTQLHTNGDPEVINMSTAHSTVVTVRHAFSSAEPSITAASYNLWKEGTVVVASAGNAGEYGVAESRGFSVFQTSVGAADLVGITSYSNYHPKVIDFYANGWNEGSVGTSISAPLVSAWVAELLEYDNSYTMSEIRTLLEYNSTYRTHDDGEGHVFNYQYLFGINTYDHVIDTRVITEAGFELFAGRNPDHSELYEWIIKIDAGVASFESLKEHLIDTVPVKLDEVAEIEIAQAHYHWYEHRESTDQEVIDYLRDGSLNLSEDSLYYTDIIA